MAVILPGQQAGINAVYKRFAGTDQAANVEVSEVVPAAKSWLLLAVTVTLVQGATQTPQPILQIDDGTVNIFESFGSTTAQAVSTTCVYTWAPGLTLTGQVGATTNVHSTAPLPADLLLAAGCHIKTSTIGLGANSNYGVPSIYIAEIG